MCPAWAPRHVPLQIPALRRRRWAKARARDRVRLSPSAPYVVFSCPTEQAQCRQNNSTKNNLNLWHRMLPGQKDAIKAQMQNRRLKSLISLHRIKTRSDACAKRFWLITAVWTVLVETIVASKSGGLSNVSNNTLDHVRVVFLVWNKKHFVQKHLFVSGKNKQTRQQHI